MVSDGKLAASDDNEDQRRFPPASQLDSSTIGFPSFLYDRERDKDKNRNSSLPSLDIDDDSKEDSGSETDTEAGDGTSKSDQNESEPLDSVDQEREATDNPGQPGDDSEFLNFDESNTHVDASESFGLSKREGGKLVELHTDNGSFRLGLKDGEYNTFRITDAAGKTVVSSSGRITVDEHKGEVTVLDDSSKGGITTVTKYGFDGSVIQNQFDKNNQKTMTIRQQVEGGRLRDSGTTKYEYSGAPGSKSTVFTASDFDAQGRLTNKRHFDSLEDLKSGKPSLTESVSYQNKGSISTEQRILTSGASSKEVGRITSSRDTNTGETVVNSKMQGAKGSIDHQMSFDKFGSLKKMEAQIDGQKIKADVAGGRIHDVMVDGKPSTTLSRDAEHRVINTINETLTGIREEFRIKGLDNPSDIKSTPERSGTNPDGTLVLTDGIGGSKTHQVKAGKILDDGKEVGTVNDAGEVRIGTKPSKIADSTGMAFHGLGSDGSRLTLTAKDDAGKLTGILSNPSGKERHFVFSGKVFDEGGQFRGDIDNEGQFVKPGREAVHADVLNKEYANWSFIGRESGNDRSFLATPDAAWGKMFVPNKSGKSSEYEVKSGMLINKQTGKQEGLVYPPEMQKDFSIKGGAIQWFSEASAVTPKPLADHRGLVFDLQLKGRSGEAGLPLKGVALGAEKIGADGNATPDIGGLYSMEQGRRADKMRSEILDQRVEEEKSHWGRRFLFQYQDHVDTATRARDYFQESSAERRNIRDRALTTGKLSDTELDGLSGAVGTSEGLREAHSISEFRNHLNDNKRALEQLPDDPNQISGKVKIPTWNNGQVVGSKQYSIERGEIKDGSNVIGRIKDSSGRIELYNTSSDEGRKTDQRMADLKGAHWQLDVPGSGQLNWISMGDRGIASVDSLKIQANQEVRLAKKVHDEGNSSASGDLYRDTQNKARLYSRVVDGIARHGVQSQADLNYLANGIGKYVAADLSDPKERAERRREESQKIHLPAMKAKSDVDAISGGKLRVGSDVFEIGKSGSLHRVPADGSPRDQTERRSGKLLPGYQAEIDGRRIDLNRAERVLMEFHQRNETHQVIGFGDQKITGNHGVKGGGLVPVEEIRRTAALNADKAANASDDYFSSKPYLTGHVGAYLGRNNTSTILKDIGTLGTRRLFTDGKPDAGGDVEDTVRSAARFVERQAEVMDKKLTEIFQAGFDPKKLDNPSLDSKLSTLEIVGAEQHTSTSDSKSIAAKGKELQDKTASSIKSGVITVATAGMGSAAYMAATKAGATALQRVQGTAAILGSAGVRGGTIGTVAHASDKSSDARNFAGGFVEGGVNAATGLFDCMLTGGKSLKQIKDAAALARKEAPITAETAMTLNSIVGKVATKYGDSAALATRAIGEGAKTIGATIGLSSGHAIREGDSSKLSAENILLGSAFMGLGHAGGKALQSGLKSTLGNRVSEAFSNTLAGKTNGALYSGLEGFHGGLKSEAQRIADEVGVRPELISINSPIFWRNVDLKNVAASTLESASLAAIAAGTVPLAMKAGALIGRIPAASGESDSKTKANPQGTTSVNDSEVKPGTQNQPGNGAKPQKSGPESSISEPLAKGEGKIVGPEQTVSAESQGTSAKSNKPADSHKAADASKSGKSSDKSTPGERREKGPSRFGKILDQLSSLFKSSDASNPYAKIGLDKNAIKRATILEKGSHTVLEGIVIAGEGTDVVAGGDAIVIASKGAKVLARENAVVKATGNAEIDASESAKVFASESADVTVRGNARAEASGKCRVKCNDNARVKVSDEVLCEADGRAIVEASGKSSVILHDQAKVTARGDSFIDTRGLNTVFAHDNARVAASASSRVEAYDNASVILTDNAKCTLRGSSTAIARDSSNVEAADSSRVTAHDSARVNASGDSTVHANGARVIVDLAGRASAYAYQGDSFKGPTVHARENSRVEAFDSGSVVATGRTNVKASGIVRVMADDHAYVQAHDLCFVYAMGNSNVRLRGRAEAFVGDNTTVHASDNTRITTVTGKARLTLTGSAEAEVQDHTQVSANQNARVFANGHVKISLRGNSMAEAKLNCDVDARDDAKVFASETTRVKASGRASVSAEDQSEVFASDNTKVTAGREAAGTDIKPGHGCYVEASGSAKVEAFAGTVNVQDKVSVVGRGNSRVISDGESHVELHDTANGTIRGNSKVSARDSSRVYATGNAAVTAGDTTSVEIIDRAAATVSGKASLISYSSDNTVKASGESTVDSFGGKVQAHDKTKVHLRNSSSEVTAFGDAQVSAMGGKVRLHERAQLTVFDGLKPAEVVADGHSTIDATGRNKTDALGRRVSDDAPTIKVHAKGNSSIRGTDKTSVEVQDHDAYPSVTGCNVSVSGSARAQARDCQVRASGNSTVDATDSSVQAFDSATIRAGGKSKVTAYDNTRLMQRGDEVTVRDYRSSGRQSKRRQ
ncbi:MAG: hypothetical protein K2X93_15795 [Candidatus Obscuribacterales bacterium]|nr:hypothetical protein [Candidatus Obscuribacterales bacterium]